MRTVPSGREPRGFRRASLRPKSLEDDLKSWPCLLREECWQVGWWRGVGATLRHEQPRPLTWAPCFRALCYDLSLHLAPQSKGSIGGNCHAPQEPMSPPQTRQQGPRVLPQQTEPASLSSRPASSGETTLPVFNSSPKGCLKGGCLKCLLNLGPGSLLQTWLVRPCRV